MDLQETTDKKEFSLENTYLQTFNEKEKKALEIAKQHLATSFDLMKSNGFNQWKNKKIT